MLLRLLKKNPSHEEVFLERYGSIMTWARNLTKNDAELAEDLVQDAFIQFTLTAPNLNEIRNLDGYLYGMLRNLCLINFRRETRNRLEQLSIYEYDSAEGGLNTVNFRDQEDARDDLQKICSFLSIRKNSARTASALILRFFHGYFPSEIAAILHTSRPAIDILLLTARREVRAFLENPKDVKFIGIDDSLKQIFQSMPVQTAVRQDEFLSQLRAVIFKFREGEHQSKEQIRNFYEQEKTSPIDVGWLSHLVSCPQCLDEVNLMLKLPKLISRFPTDAIRRDKKKKNDSDDDSNGTSGGEDSVLTKLRQKVQYVFEHKPNELRISVNGIPQGTLKADVELNELKLHLSPNEKIECVEVYSEQQVRLLLLNVDELPPIGANRQSASLTLSDNRKLDLNLEFGVQGADLHLAYHNSVFPEMTALMNSPELAESVINLPIKPSYPSSENVWTYLANLFSNRWLRVVTACSVVLIIFGLWSFQQPSNSAKAILEEAEIKAIIWQFQPNKVMHWVSKENYENSPNIADGTYFSHKWQDNTDGESANLILRYNGKKELVWGRWIKKDGTQITLKDNKIVVDPSIPALKQKLPALNPESRMVAEEHIKQIEIYSNPDQLAQSEIARIKRYYGEGEVRKHQIADKGEAICLTFESEKDTSNPKFTSYERELDFKSETYQQIRSKTTYLLNDGRTWLEEAHWLSFSESTVEEFENNDLAKLMKTFKNIEYLSVEEFTKVNQVKRTN